MALIVRSHSSHSPFFKTIHSCKGGEGLFLAVLKGTGTVYLQSLPFSRMADRIIQSAPSAGGRRVGEGSALTGRFGGKRSFYLFKSIFIHFPFILTC